MATRVRITGPTNTYSAVPVPAAPKNAGGELNMRELRKTVKAGPVNSSGAAGDRHAKAQRDLTEAKGQADLTKSTTSRRSEFEAQGGRPYRADSHAQELLGHGVAPHHVLDIVRGTSMMADPAHIGTEKAGSGEKVPRTVTQGTPNINEPHEVSPHTVPARRWEDMAPEEQSHTLRRVAMYGSSPEKMHADLTSQVLSAHERAGRNATSTPYSSLFYEGPSAPHSKLEEGADELEKHGVPRGQGRAAVVTANAATSPNTKFQQGQRFPNHEAAMHSIGHALAGGSPETVGRPEGVGGVYPANLEKAAHFATQQLSGAHLGDITLQSGRKAFDPTHAPKVTDYAGAWNEPVGPDSRYVSDVHSTHSVMPHLSTAKSIVHALPDGSRLALHPHDKVPRGAKPMTEEKNGKTVIKTSGSETEQYLSGDPVGLSALHDHIARKVATDLGLSHSVHNAGATHYLQASDWGEEQIGRSDITDRTERTAYGRDERDPLRVPAGNERVGPSSPSVSPFHRTSYIEPSARPASVVTNRQMSEPDVSGSDRDKLERGIAARSANTIKKRRKAPELHADPNYRSDTW